MWAINNQTSYKVERAFARDADGAEIWVVALRASFIIKPDGELEPAEKQQDVCLAPAYSGAPGRSSLRYDVDLVRTKPGTDVLLHASAHAPGGKAAACVDVAFAIGPLRKSLRIFGDRVWKSGFMGLRPSQPLPFVKMPICYERALGGPLTDGASSSEDPENPVGVGRVRSAGRPVPNCEYPDEPIREPSAKLRPAGFGPIACHWAPRVRLAGTYDSVWTKERRPLVPRDFQDTYFRCAPEDQQVMGFLSGGEEVVLHNLSPEGLLRFRLPRHFFGFRTRIAGDLTHHRGQIHTIILEPDERRVVMVWHSTLLCHHTLYTLMETVAFEKRRINHKALRP